MKIIDGKFGKADGKEEQRTLAEKLMIATEECVGIESKIKGNFVMIVEDEGGMARVATDLDAAGMLYLMEFIKATLMMSAFEEGAVH